MTHERRNSNNNDAEKKNYSLQKAVRERVEISYENYIKKTKEDITLNGYINKVIIRRYLDREEIVPRLKPHLKCLGIEDNAKHVLDSRNNEIYIIKRIGNNKIKCMQDDSDSCEHVFYAVASAEFPKLFQT